MITESGEDINGARAFKISRGVLFGPRHFTVFRAEIISDISQRTKGGMEKEFPTQSPINSTGDLLDIVIFFVVS